MIDLLNKTMTQKIENRAEAKKYILKRWSVTPGKTLGEMLKRYFKMSDDKAYNAAKEVFSK
jgi:hypothetical protein